MVCVNVSFRTQVIVDIAIILSICAELFMLNYTLAGDRRSCHLSTSSRTPILTESESESECYCTQLLAVQTTCYCTVFENENNI